MRRGFVLISFCVVLSAFAAYPAHSQSAVDDLKAEIRAEVKRDAGLSDVPVKKNVGNGLKPFPTSKNKKPVAAETMDSKIPPYIMLSGAAALVIALVIVVFTVGRKKTKTVNRPQNSKIPQTNSDPEKDVVKMIEDLARLKEKGIITSDEFLAKKRDLLNRI